MPELFDKFLESLLHVIHNLHDLLCMLKNNHTKARNILRIIETKDHPFCNCPNSSKQSCSRLYTGRSNFWETCLLLRRNHLARDQDAGMPVIELTCPYCESLLSIDLGTALLVRHQGLKPKKQEKDLLADVKSSSKGTIAQPTIRKATGSPET